MNETRRYRVRRELMILANSELEEQRRQADKWYLGLVNKRLEYEDVEKLSDFKGMFRRINPRTSCDMIASYIEDDCKTWPDRCPVGVKKIIVEKLKIDIEREKGTARILKTKPNEERIKKIEEQIKNLEK